MRYNIRSIPTPVRRGEFSFHEEVFFHTMAKRILSIVLCVILLAGTLVGCKSKTVAKDTGGYITMYLTDEIYDFDPANAYYNSNLSDVLSLMYATLFRLTDSGKVENYLVKSYKIYENAENDEYYMELKLKDTCWSVQDALTAEDVVFAWKRLVNSKNNYEAAALLYDNGYRNVPRNILEKGMNDLSSSDQDVIQLSLEKGLVPLSMYRNDFDFFPRALALMQTYVYEDHLEKLATAPDQELQEMASILRIADWFDRMTAMNSGHEPMSEIAAMQYFKKYPKKFLPVLVTALAECIHIIPKAASVDLSTGDKGIVLIENTRDFMRPVVLRLSDNQIYDLSDKNVYQEMQVTDIMKTMDNRVAMDEETLKQFVPDEKLRQLTQEFRRKLAAGKK